jgi:two-component system response regulator RegX3
LHILIVEDEPSLSEPLAFLLGREGYETTIAADGPTAIAEFDRIGPDLVLLDLMLPGIAGTEVCREIRTRSQTPIIMLTAKDSEVDVAVMRRRVETEDDDTAILESGDVRMDVDRHTVAVRGTETAMPLKEYELLEVLLRNSGRVLTRGQLIDRVWGADYFGDTKTLDVHIKRIRSKIELEPSDPKMLLTVRGLGYRFEP